MKVFVAGGTGVIGRHALPLLVKAGHEVSVIARSPDKAAWIAGHGGTPALIDVWDQARVRAAMAGHDVVINLTTAIPPVRRALLPGAWRENDRIRRDLSPLLVDSALTAGASRFIQESVAFTYRDGGARWLEENARVYAMDQTSTTLDAEAHCARFTRSGGTGVVLRFGVLVDPPTSGAQMIESARRGRLPLFGRPDDYISFLHTGDSGSAVVAALDAPAGVYNIVEDEPRTRGEHAETIGALVGRPVELMPSFMAGLPRLRTLARSQRVSNHRFRRATGWAPRWGGDQRGWSEIVHAREAVNA